MEPHAPLLVWKSRECRCRIQHVPFFLPFSGTTAAPDAPKMPLSWARPLLLGLAIVGSADALSTGGRCDAARPSVRPAHSSPIVAPLHARAASAVVSTAVLLHADLAFAQTSADNVYGETPDLDGFLIGFAIFLTVATGLLQLSLGDIQAEEANLPSSVSLINQNRQKSNSFIKSKK